MILVWLCLTYMFLSVSHNEHSSKYEDLVSRKETFFPTSLSKFYFLNQNNRNPLPSSASSSAPSTNRSSTTPVPPLNRFASNSSLKGTGIMGTGYYNSISPKASFDSITSLQSSGVNSIGSSSVTPWMSTASFSAVSSNPQTSDNSSRHSSLIITDNYLDSFPGRHHDQGDFLNEFSQETNKMPLKDQDLFFNPNTSNSSRHNSGVSSAASPSQVDPSVEVAFRNMAKNLQEKDKTIADCKLRLEALITALSVEGNARNDKIVQQFLETNKMDSEEIAHRIVTRLKVLTEENETLGTMLSQGRASQKEVELGILQRENSMLKHRLEGEF